MQRQFLVMANNNAGSAGEQRLGRALVELAAHGSVRVVWTGSPEDVAVAAREHPDHEVVVVGGDGTLSASVDVVISSGLADRPLGLLPGGTGNDFLRSVGSPLEIGPAASALVASRPRSMSSLEVDGRQGINALHVGVGAAASRRASGLKSTLAAAAYPIGALMSGMATSPWNLEVSSADGQTLHSGPSLMIAVVLGSSIGGGTVLAPAGAPDDQRASVLLTRHDGPMSRLALARAMTSGDPTTARLVERREAAEVHVRADRPFPVNLDGEDLGDRSELTVRVVPGSWTGVLPQP